MRFCILDFVLKLGRSRVSLMASLFPQKLIRISREFLVNLLAGAFARGGEANVGGDECENKRSDIASAMVSVLESNAWCDEVRS